ncbi:YceI family protein [Pedobacter montanisoli]|uniref:YceI family protein n=1 Tax=Pedobacter montanisoli TaxID=2923277 RepID=A0ABS9ZZ78_9SPHI|nr:YceI family protein [Pedobacter montanisoli]MCJ0743585.1 YceI family protein [Pedobacter montanisoli]
MNKLKMNGFKLIAIVMCIALLVACKKDKGNLLVMDSSAKASWKGYLETGYFNSGTIKLEGEDIFLEGDKITRGKINIPITSILITNELPLEKKIELTEHLQAVDFFNLAVHPYVTYTIRSAEKKAVDAQGNNYLIKGSMKLLGKELSLDIPAKINISNTAVSVVSNFKFDRTKWGMNFATSDDLPADKKIKNEIEIELDFTATRF